MKMSNLSILAAACMLSTSAYGLKTEDRVIKANYVVEYTKTPGAVNSFSEMFSEGDIYGRVRSHMFWWDWDNANPNGSTEDGNMWGFGGSLVYKTGYLNGFGATVGFYGSVPLVGENRNDRGNYGKSGKDTYRQDVDGHELPLGNFAEAYLEYKYGKSNIKIGRQGIDTLMIATNDTKMVPNTFEAAMIETKEIPDTNLRLGYITKQKLRDHNKFHSILAFDGAKKVNYNDDVGTHKGLTPTAIKARGASVNPDMILLNVSNKSIPNLKLDGEFLHINDYFSTAVAEANYKIALGDWTLTPGVRYIKQMDDGAGKIGGASITGKVKTQAQATTNGYKAHDSVDTHAWMARLVAESGPLSLQVGYARIADKADIIAPWRGFPTGGYVRSMAIMDWQANTKSWAVKMGYDFGKAGIMDGLKVVADYENINYDDRKIAASGLTDRNTLHVDVWKTFKSLPNTEFKFRFATIDAEKAPTAAEDYNSYNEYRFEVNYLF